jgi:hypothetical protein
VWLVDRGSVEEQEKSVLACAAAATATATREHVDGFRGTGTKGQRAARGVSRMLPRLNGSLYVCNVRSGGSTQHVHNLEALKVMCKRKRSWSGRRS